MKNSFSRRGMLATLGGAVAGLMSLAAARTAKATVQKLFVSTNAPKDYDPYKHKWLMCFDVDKCIGCGTCVAVCPSFWHMGDDGKSTLSHGDQPPV